MTNLLNARRKLIYKPHHTEETEMSDRRETAELQIAQLRYEARLAYLDGRTKRAKELNKKADDLARKDRESA